MITPLLFSKLARRWVLALAGMLGASTAALAQAPANDDCAGAITLTPATTCTPVNGTTASATQSLPAIVCNTFTGGNADDDVWYQFAATASSQTITVVGGTGFDAVVDVRSGACASTTNIGCADATAAAGTETVQMTGLTVGTTYFVRVYSYGTTTGTFTICVTAPSGAACAAVTNAAVTSSPSTATASTGTLTFTPASGATNYLLTLAPTAGGASSSATVTGSPVNLTGLTPNTAYTITITTNCSNGGVSSTVTVTFTSAAAPTVPANDDPAGAISLTPATTCTPTNGTNLAATTTTVNGYTNPGGCGIAASPKDVWYKFTTLASQTVATITVTGNPAGLVRLFSASSSAGPFTQVRCSASSATNTVAPALFATGLTPSTTYYVSVSGYGSSDTQGAFTICVTAPTGAACAGVTNAAVTSDASTTTASLGTLTFTPASGATNYYLTLAPTAGGTTTSSTVTGSPVNLTGLTPNTSYTVTLTTICSNGGVSSPVTVTFTSAAAPTVPANDDPASAISLTPATTCTPTNGTTAGATTTTASGYTNPGSCGAAVSPKDVWYKFTTLAGQTVATVTVTGNQAGLVRVFSASSGTGPFTQISCSAGSTNNTVAPAQTLTGLTQNMTYYVSVSGYGSADTPGPFTICVTAPSGAACAGVTNAAATSIAASATTSSVQVTFTAVSGASSYQVSVAPTAGGTPMSATVTSSPANFTGLTLNTSYTAAITTICSNGGVSSPVTVTFTSSGAPTTPPNNDCDGAVTLTPGATCTPVTGSTLAATQSLPGITCNGFSGTADDDVWYKFVATTTSHTVTVAGATGFDAVVDVRSGTCANSTNLNCADATVSGGTETVALTGLTVGTTYFVRVYSYGNGGTTPGNFTICVVSAPCPAVTGLAAGSTTSTGTTLTFTAAAGATNYTVTYTPAGGTAQTVTATASPVTLTGLTPGTTYAVSVVTNCSTTSTSTAATTTFATQTLGLRTTLGGGELAAFPNPAHQAFTVSIPALSARTAQLELVNALGQVVRRQSLRLTAGGTRVAVDAAGLATGLYWVRVQAGGEAAVTRLSLE